MPTERLQKNSRSEGNISIWAGQQQARPSEVTEQAAVLSKAFPKMTREFYQELMKVWIEDRWPLERIKYAVSIMKREFNYQTFTIADVVKIDKFYKTFRYDETDGKNFIRLTGNDRWVRKSDYMERPGIFDVHPNCKWLAEKWKKETLKNKAI